MYIRVLCTIIYQSDDLALSASDTFATDPRELRIQLKLNYPSKSKKGLKSDILGTFSSQRLRFAKRDIVKLQNPAS